MNFRISFAICKVVTSAESSPIKETGKRKKVESSASRKLFEEDSTDRLVLLQFQKGDVISPGIKCFLIGFA